MRGDNNTVTSQLQAMAYSPGTVDIHIVTDSMVAGLQRLLSQDDYKLNLRVTVTVVELLSSSWKI